MTSRNPISEFVIVWDNGVLTTMDSGQLSHMIDLSDCDAAEGVKAIYALNENNELIKIRLGKIAYDHDWSEESRSIVYGTQPVFAGNRLVSHVHLTNH